MIYPRNWYGIVERATLNFQDIVLHTKLQHGA